MTRRPALLLAMLAALQPAAAQPAPATLPLTKSEAAPIIGRQILDRDGAPAGRVVDVLVDGAGQTRAAVVDFGGFMGVGQRRVAIAWAALRFDPGPQTITLLMTAAEIAAAPAYPAANAMIGPADATAPP